MFSSRRAGTATVSTPGMRMGNPEEAPVRRMALQPNLVNVRTIGAPENERLRSVAFADASCSANASCSAIGVDCDADSSKPGTIIGGMSVMLFLRDQGGPYAIGSVVWLPTSTIFFVAETDGCPTSTNGLTAIGPPEL